MRRALPALVLSLALLVTAGATTAHASPARSLKLLPDLSTNTPSGFVITLDGTNRILRFNNEIDNGDIGVLELFPKEGDCDGNGNADDDRYAYQQLYRDTNQDGMFERSIDQKTKPFLAGCFVFHPEHNHWHFEDFSRYQLARVSDGKIVRAADKVSFCIVDTVHRLPDVPGSPSHAYYTSCGATATTGLSVGWGDVYTWDLPGQELNVNGLPDGQYCFISTADPDNRIIETNDTNNVATRFIQLTGNTVSNLGTSC